MPGVRISSQFGRANIGLPPQAEHRSLFLSAGTSMAPSIPETSTTASCPQEHVTAT
jgi:ferredoxin-NADP reductase